MVSGAWGVVLTVVFVVTGGYAALRLARLLSLGRAGRRRGSEVARLVELNHLVMSAAMILMVWRPSGTAGTGVQIAVFALLGLVLLLVAVTSAGATLRVGALAHVATDVAMVWMLAAMPLLMGGMAGMDSSAGGHHHGSASAAMPGMGSAGSGSVTVGGWVGPANWVAVALMAAVTLWWLVRIVGSPRSEAPHLSCHALMSAGMAVMLVLMA